MGGKCGRVGLRSDVPLSFLENNFNRRDRCHDRVQSIRIADAGIDMGPVAVSNFGKRDKVIPGELLTRLEANQASLRMPHELRIVVGKESVPFLVIEHRTKCGMHRSEQSRSKAAITDTFSRKMLKCRS